jgi:putative ABC transport system permease protein
MIGQQLRFSITEGVSIAIDALRANRVRAALTILGVAVGVFVVVVISAAIHGINVGVAQDIEAAGPNSFIVSRFPITFEACDGSDETCKWRNNPSLTTAELAALQQLPVVFAASAQIDDQAPVSYRDRTLSGPQLQGRSPNWLEVDGGDIVAGRNFSVAENQGGERVVIVNEEMDTTLFGGLDPIDKTITIRGGSFRVIGVYHYAGSFLSGGDRPRAIVPYETARRHLQGNPKWMSFTIKPRQTVSRDDAMDQVTVKLRELRGLRPGADNNFALITQDQLFDTYNKIFGMFFLVMIALSGVGLIVGGVGVVAIMMISVTERTREIGVRKALGATRRMILWQFLVEAITLTGVGSIIGLIMGWMVALALRAATPVPASVPPGAILTALLASAITGIIFGMYPAMRASQLDPVEALRYE